MKLSKIISLSVCSLVLFGTASTVMAAEGGSAVTDGTIDFEVETDPAGEIIKPETDEPIETEEGSSTTGNLRIQFVPDFNFGRQKIKTGEETYAPTYMKYQYKGQPTGKEGDYYMPQFLQVSDTRGTNEGFTLTVKGTTFKRKTGDELPFATIALTDGRLSNNVFSEAEIKERVDTFKGVSNVGTGKLVIPTGTADAMPVMMTKSNEKVHSTNGTQTSLILSSTYDKDKLDYLATDKNEDVIFTKTNKDIPTITPVAPAELDPYESKITWTLTAGI